jgi:chorismate synthase
MAVIDGMPSGLRVMASAIDEDLKRRQGGYGRGGRMTIEKDRVQIISGIRHGVTTGAPLGLLIENRDWEAWKDIMAIEAGAKGIDLRAVTRPRPGHADLAAGLKYDLQDLRDALERSSARETAMRVAAGSLAKRLLNEFGISVLSWVTAIGAVQCKPFKEGARAESLYRLAEASEVRCPDKRASTLMKKAIDSARDKGDSLGGVFEVSVTGAPPGIGSHTQWDRKLDARLSMALMSIQAIKGVEAGIGFKGASMPGSMVHDEIFYGNCAGFNKQGFWPIKRRFFRRTNNAGGIEGGTSNGEDLIMRAVMKPIPTLYKPLSSVDIKTKRPFKAAVERSDISAVPAASVVGEAVVAFEVASAFLEKTGGDSIREIKRNYKAYLRQVTGY